MADGSGFCDKPDRHSPKTRCGYPMPCPYHTFVVTETGILLIPKYATKEQIERAKQVRDALRGKL